MTVKLMHWLLLFISTTTILSLPSLIYYVPSSPLLARTILIYCYYWIPRVLVFMNRIHEILSQRTRLVLARIENVPWHPPFKPLDFAATPSLKLCIDFVEIQGLSIVTAEEGPKVQRVWPRWRRPQDLTLLHSMGVAFSFNSGQIQITLTKVLHWKPLPIPLPLLLLSVSVLQLL